MFRYEKQGPYTMLVFLGSAAFAEFFAIKIAFMLTYQSEYGKKMELNQKIEKYRLIQAKRAGTRHLSWALCLSSLQQPLWVYSTGTKILIQLCLHEDLIILMCKKCHFCRQTAASGDIALYSFIGTKRKHLSRKSINFARISPLWRHVSTFSNLLWRN